MPEVKVDKGQAVAQRNAPESGRRGGLLRPMFNPWRGFGLSPFAFMREFTDEMDRMFGSSLSSAERGTWAPAMDVRQCDGNLVVSAELPGLRKEDVKVELTDDSLIIQGERKHEHKEDHEGYHRYERSYGQFYRAIPLPEGARADEAKADLTDGLLKVTVPVSEHQKKSRQIPIGEGLKTKAAG